MGYNDTYRLSAHAVIADKDGHVLQLKQTYGDKRWGLPGGSLEPGETIHAAVVRECLEELGVNVQVEYLSGVYYHAAYNAHVFIFKCSLAEDASLTLSSEHSEYRYFSLDELTVVQRQRVLDCLDFAGDVRSRSF